MADHFRIELKAWIPYPMVVDPEMPAPRLAPMFLAFLAKADPVGVVTGDTKYVAYTSNYHGDDHPTYSAQTPPYTSATANHRVCRWCEFDWDGTSISNFTPAPADVDSPADQNTVYGTTVLLEHREYVLKTVPTTDDPKTPLTATSKTTATGGGKDFSITIVSSNPLIIAKPLCPPINGALVGTFDGGKLNMTVSSHHFPSFGVRVQKNGTDLWATYETPVKDAQKIPDEKGIDINGVDGAIALFALLAIADADMPFSVDV